MEKHEKDFRLEHNVLLGEYHMVYLFDWYMQLAEAFHADQSKKLTSFESNTHFLPNFHIVQNMTSVHIVNTI